MKNKSVNDEVGICGVVAIVFIVLKLVGVISWKWIWVLSPIWIGGGLGMIRLIVFIVLVKIRKY